jgi:lipopolysaccharide transport system ATP-binding protein
MRNGLAIRVEHLSKKYTLRGPQKRYRTIRDSIMETLASPFRTGGNGGSSDLSKRSNTDFLALDDISFAVPHGEVLGVMGHNGAGKSTLLKILSRITEPSSGSATLFGRVGSLLEVGTGFHPELSGRENIYLSGAILGMKKREIQDKFDEIVSFAEVDRFVDTPIKHYSSGMHLRLAFAVAAHLQPEILLIDEVLAVGDAKFQHKCLGKMEDVAASGRTVLFVSHNLAAIKELCRTGIVLSHGQLLVEGPVVEAIAKYTQSTQEPILASTTRGWQHFELIEPETEDGWVIRPEDRTSYRANLVLPEQFARGFIMLVIHDSTGALIVAQRTELDRNLGLRSHSRHVSICASVPPLWLSPGIYTVHFKFLGRTTQGVDARYVSERRVLDVKGWSDQRTSSVLAPTCHWSVQAIDSMPEA